MMRRYNSVNSYFKNKFGKKVYKLAIDGGFTCPNRDGKVGTGGCIFCSNCGSGDFAAEGENINIQIENAIKKVGSKVPDDCGFICYFQSFTGTYAPTKKLNRLYFDAIQNEKIVALSVATRPDCLEDEKILLLEKINKIKPVFVELGLQTSNEKTADFINRCYKNEVFTTAVKNLRKANIEVIVHIIIGLPGENLNDILNTVKFVSSHDIQGIKLQLLHVLKNTPLAKMDYTPLEMNEYFKILGECLEILPQNIVIHRLTGDGAKKDLIAPLWSADKHKVLNSLNKYLDENNIIQGRKFK